MVTMLPHVIQGNQMKRVDQIIALSYKICTEHPVRIVIEKVIERVCLINLSWILAICRKNYNRIDDVDFRDIGLNGLQENIKTELIKSMELDEKLHSQCQYLDDSNLCYDQHYFENPEKKEIDLVYGATYTKTLNYILPADIVISLLSRHELFKPYLLTADSLKNPPLISKQKLRMENDRPSNKGRGKSEIICLELEKAITKNNLHPLNHETLWNALLKEVESPQSFLQKNSHNTVKEKSTPKIWNKENATYQMKKVIQWYKNDKK